MSYAEPRICKLWDAGTTGLNTVTVNVVLNVHTDVEYDLTITDGYIKTVTQDIDYNHDFVFTRVAFSAATLDQQLWDGAAYNAANTPTTIGDSEYSLFRMCCDIVPAFTDNYSPAIVRYGNGNEPAMQSSSPVWFIEDTFANDYHEVCDPAPPDLLDDTDDITLFGTVELRCNPLNRYGLDNTTLVDQSPQTAAFTVQLGLTGTHIPDIADGINYTAEVPIHIWNLLRSADDDPDIGGTITLTTSAPSGAIITVNSWTCEAVITITVT